MTSRTTSSSRTACSPTTISDIANNHERRDYKAFIRANSGRTTCSGRRADRSTRSMHRSSSGARPRVRCRRRIRARSVAIALLAALTALAIFDLASAFDQRRSRDAGLDRDLPDRPVRSARMAHLSRASGRLDRGVVGALALAWGRVTSTSLRPRSTARGVAMAAYQVHRPARTAGGAAGDAPVAASQRRSHFWPRRSPYP